MVEPASWNFTSLFLILSHSPTKQELLTLKKTKFSGVRWTTIVGILLPDASEKYYNTKALWMGAGIHKMEKPFTTAADLKFSQYPSWIDGSRVFTFMLQLWRRQILSGKKGEETT